MRSFASPLNTNIAYAKKIIWQSFIPQTFAEIRVIYMSFDQGILSEIECLNSKEDDRLNNF